MKTECPHCGQHYEVEENFAGQNVECSKCGKAFTVSAPEKTRRCPMCGEEILAVAKKCKHCGEYLDETAKPDQKKSRLFYVLSGLFLGGFGAHNFYIGQPLRGYGKIALSFFGFILLQQPKGDVSLAGALLLSLNSFWILWDISVDPSNTEAMKYTARWQCIVLSLLAIAAVVVVINFLNF